jgi:hypothetical protein
MARLCKHNKQRCGTKNCRRDSNGRQFCSTCRSRKSRAKDIIKHAYNNKKSDAKRRGIPFTITLAYFRRFCYRYKFVKNMGRTAHSYSVDRKKNHLGYIPGNIQALTISQNASKGTRVMSYDWYHRTAKYF